MPPEIVPPSKTTSKDDYKSEADHHNARVASGFSKTAQTAYDTQQTLLDLIDEKLGEIKRSVSEQAIKTPPTTVTRQSSSPALHQPAATASGSTGGAHAPSLSSAKKQTAADDSPARRKSTGPSWL